MSMSIGLDGIGAGTFNDKFVISPSDATRAQDGNRISPEIRTEIRIGAIDEAADETADDASNGADNDGDVTEGGDETGDGTVHVDDGVGGTGAGNCR